MQFVTVLHDDCGAVTNFIDEKFVAEKLAEFQAKCSWHKGKKLIKKLNAEIAKYKAEITRDFNAANKAVLDALVTQVKQLDAAVEKAQELKTRDGSVGKAKEAVAEVKKKILAHKKPLEDRLSALDNALSDKGSRLSNHFHRSAAESDEQNLPLLRDKAAYFKSRLLNCTKHWAPEEDHTSCGSSAPCRQSGWLRDTVPLNADAAEVLKVSPLLRMFFNLYLIFCVAHLVHEGAQDRHVRRGAQVLRTRARNLRHRVLQLFPQNVGAQVSLLFQILPHANSNGCHALEREQGQLEKRTRAPKSATEGQARPRADALA